MTSTTTTRTALAAIATAVAFTAFAPAYAAGPNAGDRTGQRDQMQAHRQGGQMQKGEHDGMRNGRGNGQFLAIGCGPNAAERIETSLVKLGYRVDATAEQKTLLESLKTAALAAQSELAATCDTLMPAPDMAAAPDAAAPAPAGDLLETMKQRLKVEEARVAAMTSVLPEFEAFYNSLTDEQKAALQPAAHQRGDGRGPGRDGAPHGGKGMRPNG